jgi:hypothetical protein
MRGNIAHNLVLLGLTLSRIGWGVDEVPTFSPAGILCGDRTVAILVPGAGMSICGRYLGPSEGCAGRAAPNQFETLLPAFADLSVYPGQLCGVQVLIGGEPAGLLYVSERQINFNLPQQSPDGGTVELRVLYNGRSSAPVKMPAGFKKIAISLDQPAYSDMPVWIRIDLPFEFTGLMRYPFVLSPAGSGCNEVEVRRNGQLLPPLSSSNWTRYLSVMPGNICGSYVEPTNGAKPGRLPLLLLYRFDAAGTYEVRFTLRHRPIDVSQRGEIRAESEWTPIESFPSKPNQHADWLDGLQRSMQSDRASFLSDVLPGVVGFADDASLEIVLRCLYHSEAAVRFYALNGLSYWPGQSTSPRLLAMLQSRGPNEEVIRYLSRQNAVSALPAK